MGFKRGVFRVCVLFASVLVFVLLPGLVQAQSKWSFSSKLTRRERLTIYRFDDTYLEIRYGNLPIILTAPHAGEENPGDMDERECLADNFPDDCKDLSPKKGFERIGKCCRGGSCSTVKSDAMTKLLTLTLAKEISRLFGGTPYVVISNVKRQYVDLNRDAKSFEQSFHDNDSDVEFSEASFCSFDDPRGMEHWENYHNAVEAMLDHMQAQFGSEGMQRALLINVHGTGEYEDVLTLGTGRWNGQAGQTLPNMRSRDASLPFLFTSIRGFISRLVYNFQQERVLNAFPTSVDVQPYFLTHDSPLQGGYDVQRYSRVYTGTFAWGGPQSSPSRPMIDSIQLEYGSHLRQCQDGDGDWSFCDDTVLQSARATAQALYDAWGLR